MGRETAGAPPALVLAFGLAAYLALHFLAPPLAMTWGFAHLDRRAWLPWVAAALVAALPAATLAIWERPALAAPPRPVGWGTALGAVALAWLALGVAGALSPAPAVSVDPVAYVQGVATGSGLVARWYLTVWSLSHVAAWLAPVAGVVAVIRGASALSVAVALAALAGAARQLGRTRGEALAITLLASTAFGVLQLGLGYIDVYPIPLAATALYVWTGLRAVRGTGHPAWPFAIAAVGPFWYVGLVLLAPSLVVLAALALRRPGEGRRLALAVGVAVLAAGAATLPATGRPFAWGTVLAQVVAASTWAPRPGWSSGDLLPVAYMVGARHAAEVLQLVVLIDGVGVLLLVVAGATALARGAWDPAAAFLGLIVIAWLAYLIAMDPVYGPYADWDLFGYGAAVTSLLGAFAFVAWGRTCPRLFAPLLGLALAAAGVHLLARLNALDVDFHIHAIESPFHLG